MSGMLEGMRIVEGSAFVAAPSSGMSLAQLGAEVIRFDPIGGGLDYTRWPITDDGKSLFWAGMNKGKKSIMVDLRSEKGREIITNLICAPGKDNGIFLTNFPEKGWLSYDALKKHREDLIMVNIQGTYKGKSAVDYTVNPSVGFPRATGPEGTHDPVNHVLPAWDKITGQKACVGLLAAERYRNKTGKGQIVKIALHDVALAACGNLGKIAEVQINKTNRMKQGNYLFGAFGRDFITGDGQQIMIVGLTMRQWKGICKATGLGEKFDQLENRLGLDFTNEGHRFQARREIAEILEPWISHRRVADFRDLFNENGVCWGRYQTFAEMVHHDTDCSEENPMFKTVEQPGIGKYLMPSSPLDFSAEPRIPPQPAPILGQHTDQILTEILGMSDLEIAKLHDEKVVAGPVK